jgi:23S rRNA (uridine2552-2'-O)-methyltransferase
LAPSTSGNKDGDRARSFDLVMRALEVARAHGKPGSSFVAKIFMGSEYEEARREIRRTYAEVRTLRPESVRKNSVEVFLVALGKK